MNKDHYLWDKTISYAEGCSWKAGPYLADIMRSGQLSDIERIIIACEDGEIIGFCTLAEKDCMRNTVSRRSAMWKRYTEQQISFFERNYKRKTGCEGLERIPLSS